MGNVNMAVVVACVEIRTDIYDFRYTANGLGRHTHTYARTHSSYNPIINHVTVHFYRIPPLPRFQKEHCFLEGSKTLPVCPSGKSNT